MRPILANACAAATTAAEARYRLPILPRDTWRSSRVIALDPAAAEIVRRVAAQPWASATFYTVAGAAAGLLRTLDGAQRAVDEVLPGADLVVLVATSDSGAAAAAAIGAECRARSIMTAGLIIDESPERTGPSRADPGRAGPGRAGPGRAGPSGVASGSVVPNQAAPGRVTPDSTALDGVVPAASDGTAPDGTAPDGTAPDGTAPDGTAPDSTAPDSTVPDATASDGTVPGGTAPDGAASGGAAPAGVIRHGLVVEGMDGVRGVPDRVVSVLRPYAPVLMVTRDEQDVAEVLTALRA